MPIGCIAVPDVVAGGRVIEGRWWTDDDGRADIQPPELTTAAGSRQARAVPSFISPPGIRGAERKEEQTVLRTYDATAIKLRQQEMLQDAERRRLASRVNRQERTTDSARSALSLRFVWAR